MLREHIYRDFLNIFRTRTPLSSYVNGKLNSNTCAKLLTTDTKITNWIILSYMLPFIRTRIAHSYDV